VSCFYLLFVHIAHHILQGFVLFGEVKVVVLSDSRIFCALLVCPRAVARFYPGYLIFVGSSVQTLAKAVGSRCPLQGSRRARRLWGGGAVAGSGGGKPPSK
jgi:hypothetical protein